MKWIVIVAVLSALALGQSEEPKPKTFVLNCKGGDCPLLKGKPHTGGMRGGLVRLKPGESVGWHSTADNEESLVILHGRGTAKIEGRSDMPFGENQLVYIPAATRHNVTNTGADILEYVWIVAPVATGEKR